MKKEKTNYLTKRDVGRIFGLDRDAVRFIFDSPKFPKKIVNVNGRDAPVVEADDCMAYFRMMS